MLVDQEGDSTLAAVSPHGLLRPYPGASTLQPSGAGTFPWPLIKEDSKVVGEHEREKKGTCREKLGKMVASLGVPG